MSLPDSFGQSRSGLSSFDRDSPVKPANDNFSPVRASLHGVDLTTFPVYVAPRMELETDEIALDKCKKLIEDQLGWGDSNWWSTNDFEILSTRIHEKTGVNLSIATLKRLWGKIKYDSKPTPTTLNTLAQYLGFENWRSFRAGEKKQALPFTSTFDENVAKIKSQAYQQEKEKVQAGNRAFMSSLVIVLFVATISATLWLILRGQSIKPKANPEKFQFSSKKVVDFGVPNTVIFDYDATSAAPDDSIFIQQSWDKRLSRQVRREQKTHSSIYYYPGFFEAKLVVDGTIVKEHNLLITTDGWLPLIEQKETPIYFKAQDAANGNGLLQLPVEKISSSNVAMQPNAPWIAYYNVRGFGNLTSNDMVFETSLKNDYSDGSNACQFVEIRLQFEGPAILIPVSAKGCVSMLEFGGTDGTEHDLSKFGVDFNDWVNVRCVTRDGNGEIFINGVSAATFTIRNVPRKMVGIGFRFKGTGSVDHVQLSNSKGDLIYSENFGK